jgi:hypothetical protein
LLANLDNRLFTYKVNAYLGCGQNYNTPKQQLSSGNFCTVKPLLPPNAFVPLFPQGGHPDSRASCLSRCFFCCLGRGDLRGAGSSRAPPAFWFPLPLKALCAVGLQAVLWERGGSQPTLSELASAGIAGAAIVREPEGSEDQKRRSEAKIRSEDQKRIRSYESLPFQRGPRPAPPGPNRRAAAVALSLLDYLKFGIERLTGPVDSRITSSGSTVIISRGSAVS